jgi:transposase
MRSDYVVSDASPSAVQFRQQWFKEYELLGNARVTCQHFGISRKTFYKWLRRYKDSGNNPASLADLPRTPHHSPRRTREEVRQWVIAIRSTTGYGPRRLRRELIEQKGVQLSERTIWKIIRGAPAQNEERQIEYRPTPMLETMSRVAVGA